MNDVSDARITTLNKRMKELAEKFDELKKIGFDEDILKIYIKHETGLSMRDVTKVLEAYDKFYDKLLVKWTAKNL